MIATKCNRCGRIGTCHCNGNVFKTIHENTVLINPPNQGNEYVKTTMKELLSLNKYHHDRYGDLEINDEGEYLLLSDVLALFSR